MNPFWGINIKERFLGCIFLERQHLRKKPLRSSKSSFCDHRSFLLHIFFEQLRKKGNIWNSHVSAFFRWYLMCCLCITHLPLSLNFRQDHPNLSAFIIWRCPNLTALDFSALEEKESRRKCCEASLKAFFCVISNNQQTMLAFNVPCYYHRVKDDLPWWLSIFFAVVQTNIRCDCNGLGYVIYDMCTYFDGIKTTSGRSSAPISTFHCAIIIL